MNPNPWEGIWWGENSNLLAARRIYRRAGFRMVEEVPHDEYGEGLVAENWEMDL
jgi:hypothetical protein